MTLILTTTNIKIAKADTANISAFRSTVFDETVTNEPEITIIDRMANEYFNYFKANGVTKEDIMDIANSSVNDSNQKSSKLFNNKLNNIINYSNITLSSTSTYYSTLVYDITGYSFTYEQIAAQLASLGVLMNLSSALPFLEYLAILAGAVIITLAIAVAYLAVAVAVHNLILTWYLDIAYKLEIALSNTRVLVAQYEHGYRYWRAYLANYGGRGGILIGDPIPYPTAIDIVLIDISTYNVFAMTHGDAMFLAQTAYGIGYTNPEVHRQNGKDLNVQHIHALKPGNGRGNCHIFFGIPTYF